MQDARLSGAQHESLFGQKQYLVIQMERNNKKKKKKNESIRGKE
jgi:hypothetical protein